MRPPSVASSLVRPGEPNAPVRRRVVAPCVPAAFRREFRTVFLLSTARLQGRPYASSMDGASTRVAGRRVVAAEDVVDVFVYVIALNLATEYFPQVVTESFTVSILTALMLKAVLEVVLAVKQRVKRRLAAASGTAGKILGALSLWVILAGSKFLVLKIEDLLFGDRVELGGFFAVTGLIITLMLAREGVRRLLAGQRSPQG